MKLNVFDVLHALLLQDIRGFTALHIACCRGVLPVVRLLIDSDSWLIDAASFDGVTPLHVYVLYMPYLMSTISILFIYMCIELQSMTNFS